MALSGATANVQPYVLDFAERVGARAGIRQPLKVLSGYRPGATIINSDRPSLHASGRAVDLGVYYGRTLTRLGQAALAEAGGDPRRLSFAGTVNGWEIIFNSFVGGNHFDHLHVGWEGAGVATGVDRRAPSSSSALSRQELADVWLSAGGNPRAATMAAAVALRESGGRPNARNLSKREDSRGLWQINVRAHPQWALRNLYNPRVNAQAAIAISSNGRNWSPWTTAAAARADVQGVGGTVSVERPGGESGGGLWESVRGYVPGYGWLFGKGAGAGGIFGWAEAVISAVLFFTDPLNWLRLFEVVAGFTLMFGGIAILVVEFGSKSKAAGTAASIIPAARAGTALKGATRA